MQSPDEGGDRRPLSFPMTGRIPQIDLLKAFAIISVILLHTFPEPFFLAIGSPYHLWHAVPLFILISGFTLAYGYRKRGAFTLGECYDPKLVSRRFLRLIVPFAIFWVLELIILSLLAPVPRIQDHFF